MANIVISFLILFSILLYLDHNRLLLFLPQSKSQVRYEVEEIYKKVNVGQSRATVENFVKNYTKGKKFKVHEKTSSIYIIPPTELDGLTWFWTILIFFDDDNVVEGVAIRPTDGYKYWFCEAPKDKGYIAERYKGDGDCIE